MSRKHLIFLTTVVVIVAAGFTVYALESRRPNSESPPQQTSVEVTKPAAGAVTVTYDSNGFSPKEIVVAKGTTVSFDNKTEIPMWVASDPHPDHFDYPEFDVIRLNGQYPEPRNDFSFTFDKPGTWTYHNHTMPGDIGKVTVQ